MILGVGHTVRSAGRRPRASLQQAVRTLSVGMEVFTPPNNSPSKNLFEISSMEEEYRTSSNFH